MTGTLRNGRPEPLTDRKEIEAALRRLAPNTPEHEFASVVDHAIDSRGLGHAAPETAAWLSLVAYVRHVFTDYDDLRDQDYDEDSARFFVMEQMQAVLQEWGVRRQLTSQD